MRVADGMNEEQKKRIAIGGAVAVALALLWYELSGTGVLPWESNATSAPVAVTSVAAPATALPPPAPTASAARPGQPNPVRLTAAQLDPTLHMGAMLVTESLVYSGSGRNIFSSISTPVVVIPKPIAPIRPKPVIATAPTAPTGPPPPPPPPPIDLVFFGTETSASGIRQAFLLHGTDVFLAASGDIVLRRYRIVAVNPTSIQVEDLSNSNKQTLPLQASM